MMILPQDTNNQDRSDQLMLCFRSASEVQAQYNTNIFGLLRILRVILPYMRAQKFGVIANLGSIGGWRGTPAAGIYCSTIFAVAGISQSLKAEVEALGTDVTCIEPGKQKQSREINTHRANIGILGYFRTNFLTGDHHQRAEKHIADFKHVTDQMHATFNAYSEKQHGDPKKAAVIIVDCLTHQEPWAGALPSRLALGKDAVSFITAEVEREQAFLEQWALTVSKTDCDDVVQEVKE
jgi:NAD(P)-dependent dehydrogenase (short-subunit alcohol dehydrogenase family)